MKKLLLLITLATMATLAVAQRIELRATLVGAGTGKAVWKTRDQVGQLEAEFSVEAERLRPGALYRIVIGPYVWQMFANALGDIDFDRRYTTSIRPRIVRGTPVQIRNISGVAVLSGKFQ